MKKSCKPRILTCYEKLVMKFFRHGKVRKKAVDINCLTSKYFCYALAKSKDIVLHKQ